MSDSLDALAAPTAAKQHGLITRRQVRDLGGTPRQIERRLANGEWLLAETGVYRIAGAPFTWHTRVLAPCLAIDGVASHRSAAVLWSLDGFRQGRPEISIPRSKRLRRADVRVHESRDLDLAGVRRIQGVPVTGIERTLIDLGAVVSVDLVEESTFEVIDRRISRWGRLVDVFVSHARSGRAGIGPMREVLERNLDRAVPQRRLEVRLERLLRSAGLPQPERQVSVFDVDGEIGRMDFSFSAARVAVETDGRSVHARRKAFSKDHARRNRISLAGWTVLVFTWEQVFGQPDLVIAQVSAAVAPHFAGDCPP